MNTRIFFCQSRPCVGAVERNCAHILQLLHEARECRADIVVLPELFLSGYPPEDLLFRPEMANKIDSACKQLARATKKIALLVGSPWYQENTVYNAALWFAHGQLAHVYRKQHLPDYAVFDESRYFTAGNQDCLIEHNGFRFLVTICEDLWQGDIKTSLKRHSPHCLISINGSPFYIDRLAERISHVCSLANQNNTAIAYLNMVAAQDELVFDGGSFVCDSGGNLVGNCRQFSADSLSCDFTPRAVLGNKRNRELPAIEQLFLALVEGVRGYVHANGFDSVVLGLSGGIDSAVTLSIACAAVGSKNVHTVMMPYNYTSSISLQDAQQVAKNHGVTHKVISIQQPAEAFIQLLQPHCDAQSNGWQLALQNIQARCRAVLLMAIANHDNRLLLCTGNKSEMAVGYCTLYGDMAGGFAVLKDVSKTHVYQLADYCNRYQERIPQRIINRPPSAELMPNQQDSDNLPEYGLLDKLLHGYIEKRLSTKKLIALADKATVQKVLSMVDGSEHKRRQATVGTRVTKVGFGKDWRMPLSNRWQHPL